MPSLSLGARWLSSLRKYWWANERGWSRGGGGSCPSQRATRMNLIRINPLRKRPWVASFIDSPNYSEIQISTARGWLDSICTYFLMRFKWKHVLPREIPHIIFFESGPRLSFFFFFESWHIMHAPADCIMVEELRIKWHVCQHVLPAEEALQRPCNWPWLHSTTRSNQVTMRNIFLASTRP